MSRVRGGCGRGGSELMRRTLRRLATGAALGGAPVGVSRGGGGCGRGGSERMRRTLRRLATVAALVSLLLCVASVVMWARSYWKSDWWSRFSYNVQTHEYRQQFLGSEAGKAA